MSMLTEVQWVVFNNVAMRPTPVSRWAELINDKTWALSFTRTCQRGGLHLESCQNLQRKLVRFSKNLEGKQ